MEPLASVMSCPQARGKMDEKSQGLRGETCVHEYSIARSATSESVFDSCGRWHACGGNGCPD